MITVQRQGDVSVVTIDRPERRNAIDRATANALLQCFERFDSDPSQHVAVLTGVDGVFSSGADLHTLTDPAQRLRHDPPPAPAPLGVSRLQLSKPVIAAVEGYAVAGGLELALWADMRVASASAVFGVFSRRWGVPLIDLGAVRLPRLIGHSHAMDMILTGRPVDANEALMMGLANRVVPTGEALEAAVELAAQIARFPQACLRADRQMAIEQWDLDDERWHMREYLRGRTVMQDPQTVRGVRRFQEGAGRHGASA